MLRIFGQERKVRENDKDKKGIFNVTGMHL